MMDPKQAKETVRDQFSRNAEKYVTSSIHAKGDDLPLLVEWLEPGADWQVLDAATGGGHVSKALSPFVAQIVATDLTKEMLAAARKHLIEEGCDNVGFVVADAEDLPFLDDSFDAVTCRIAAHHFPDPGRFITEAARVLKRGGKLLLIDNVVPEEARLDLFINTLEKLRDESHVRCCSLAQWTGWMKDAGLEVRKQRVRKKTFEFPTWVRRTARTEEQVKQVESHILKADKDLQEYCGLVLKDGAIRSITIDEWMVVAGKE